MNLYDVVAVANAGVNDVKPFMAFTTQDFDRMWVPFIAAVLVQSDFPISQILNKRPRCFQHLQSLRHANDRARTWREAYRRGLHRWVNSLQADGYLLCHEVCRERIESR
jgi:hypothetical protein